MCHRIYTEHVFQGEFYETRMIVPSVVTTDVTVKNLLKINIKFIFFIYFICIFDMFTITFIN